MSKFSLIALLLCSCATTAPPVAKPIEGPATCTPPLDHVFIESVQADLVECRFYDGAAAICVYGVQMKTKACAAMLAREACAGTWKLVKAACQKEPETGVGERL